MKTTMMSRIPVLALVLAGLTAVPVEAGTSCHLINARAVGTDPTGGHPSGKVIGGGLLQGSVAGTITSFIPDAPPATLASFTETVIFTNQHGAVTVELTGKIDTASGVFNASGTVTGATGKLAGATGTLSFSGDVDFATGAFSENINGVVCVDLAP